jgi:hypothetical protein
MASNTEHVRRREEVKFRIRQRFDRYVRGQTPTLEGFNTRHDGAEGDWLTKQMGLAPNGRNEPDFEGFEMKKFSKTKTSFGDWSPDISVYKGPTKLVNREVFLQLFGAPNPRKSNRYSWSGSVFPKVGSVNQAGQSIAIDSSGDIIIKYEYLKDGRDEKFQIKEHIALHQNLELARWKKASLERKVAQKFGQLGWFRCLKDRNGRYDALQFGFPISYAQFMELFRVGDIFLDCGMHQGNSRPYMTWRASNQVWDKLAER